MVRTKLNIGCRYSTPVLERPLHPTRSQFKPQPSQTQAPVTPATEPERRAGGGLTTACPAPSGRPAGHGHGACDQDRPEIAPGPSSISCPISACRRSSAGAAPAAASVTSPPGEASTISSFSGAHPPFGLASIRTRISALESHLVRPDGAGQRFRGTRHRGRPDASCATSTSDRARAVRPGRAGQILAPVLAPRRPPHLVHR